MNKTSIVFTGDIGFDRYMEGRFRDEQLISDEVYAFFHSADHVAANVEGALINVDDNGSHGAFFHCMNPEAISVFKKMHADIWCIGNNHITDAGNDGVSSTLTLAKDHGCLTVGAGMNIEQASTPVYLDEAGGIGLLGVTYMAENLPATETNAGVFRWDDWARIAARITEIKQRCRWCVIVAHGGEEFAPMPLPYTRDRYLKYLELGADVVVGHHPHVPENYELFGDQKAIFYSLGNFIFDTDYQRAHRYTDVGVLLKLIFTEEALSFEALGTRIVRGEECIEAAELPPIFADVSAAEYDRLAALAATAFVAEEQRKMIYLEPNRFINASEDDWDKYFFSEEPDGYFKDAHMDLGLVVPFARTVDEAVWDKSELAPVKEYLLSLL